MLCIDINSLHFEYRELPFPVFKDLSLQIYKGDKIGLIGKNGSGKSTLFKLILKKIKPQKGRIHITDNTEIGYLPQEITSNKKMTAIEYIFSFNKDILKAKRILSNPENSSRHDIIFAVNIYDKFNGYSLEKKVDKFVDQLEIDSDILHNKIDTLSGGEKTKILLLKTHLCNANLLLLDEPTNNLDEKHINWLEGYLKSNSFSYVLISHDRQFLDNTVNKIFELKSGCINEYTGNYSMYRETKKRIRNEKKKEYEKLKRKIKNLKNDMNRRKQHAFKREKAKPKRSISKKGSIQKRDGGVPVIRREQSLMKGAKSLESRVNRIKKKAQNVKPEKIKDRDIKIFNKKIRKNVLLKAKNITKYYNNKKVLNNFTLILPNGEKVAIKGNNGTGKTTFLNIITDTIKEYKGSVNWTKNLKVTYYDQDISRLNPDNTILDEITGGNLNIQTKARIILGTLNITGEQVYKLIKNLSVGMRNKTLLGKIIFSDPDVMILDEPTNHLEISTRESLIRALKNYNGSLLFTSHDRYFRKNLATKVVNI